MMKRLAIFFGVAFIAAVILVARFGDKYDTGSNDFDIKCVQDSPPSSDAASLACTIHSSKDADQGKLSPPWWYKLVAWPGGITAWLLLFTLDAIVWQAIYTRKAADATKVAAEAALKQTHHMVNSERAWVMAELRFEHGGGLMIRGAPPCQQTMANVVLSIKNTGSTPAWVYEQFIHLEVSPKIIASLETYESPNFPFLGQGKEMFVSREIHPISQGDDPIGTGAWVEDSGVATSENGLHVYIYGVVRYRDAFSTERETYFGYSAKGNNRLERIPNEAYNKHT
jgi:hypothetical protein